MGLPLDLISVGEAARLLGFDPGTLRRWVHSGRLPGWQATPRGALRVSRADLAGLMRPVGVPPASPAAGERAYERGMEACRRMGLKV